ncbi:MAG: hypothetical protein NC489_32265 [Ruminococcus flavefaciens]|nr:hypothetical protein [Ruminococcus flavefaciens]
MGDHGIYHRTYTAYMDRAGTFLDLRDIHQSRRNMNKDYAQCKNKPRHDTFVELDTIKY